MTDGDVTWDGMLRDIKNAISHIIGQQPSQIDGNGHHGDENAGSHSDDGHSDGGRPIWQAVTVESSVTFTQAQFDWFMLWSVWSGIALGAVSLLFTLLSSIRSVFAKP